MEGSGDGWLSLGALWGMSLVMGLCIGEKQCLCFQALKSENFSHSTFFQFTIQKDLSNEKA